MTLHLAIIERCLLFSKYCHIYSFTFFSIGFHSGRDFILIFKEWNCMGKGRRGGRRRRRREKERKSKLRFDWWEEDGRPARRLLVTKGMEKGKEIGEDEEEEKNVESSSKGDACLRQLSLEGGREGGKRERDFKNRMDWSAWIPTCQKSVALRHSQSWPAAAAWTRCATCGFSSPSPSPFLEASQPVYGLAYGMSSSRVIKLVCCCAIRNV